MTDAVDRDFGADDTRSWSIPELFDEIARRACDALDAREEASAPVLGILLDLARLRVTLTPETQPNEGE